MPTEERESLRTKCFIFFTQIISLIIDVCDFMELYSGKKVGEGAVGYFFIFFLFFRNGGFFIICEIFKVIRMRGNCCL